MTHVFTFVTRVVRRLHFSGLVLAFAGPLTRFPAFVTRIVGLVKFRFGSFALVGVVISSDREWVGKVGNASFS